MTSHDSIWHHTHSLWNHNTVFFTSHPLYSWQHTQSIWHHVLYTCDIAATVFRQDTSYVYDIILRMYDISHGVRMMVQPRYLTSHSLCLCNLIHLIDDIPNYVCMKSHPLHVGHHRHYLWHHILSWWHHTIVCMSWHPLGLWYHIHYIWWHTHCVYDNTSSISDLKSILSAITSTVYVITPTVSKTSH